jgi:hypothetical protein
MATQRSLFTTTTVSTSSRSAKTGSAFLPARRAQPSNLQRSQPSARSISKDKSNPFRQVDSSVACHFCVASFADLFIFFTSQFTTTLVTSGRDSFESLVGLLFIGVWDYGPSIIHLLLLIVRDVRGKSDRATAFPPLSPFCSRYAYES